MNTQTDHSNKNTTDLHVGSSIDVNSSDNEVLKGKHDYHKKCYDLLSNENLQCIYCSKITSLWNINRHLEGKNCLKFKQKYLNINKNKKMNLNSILMN
jgi:hypothetical protein